METFLDLLSHRGEHLVGRVGGPLQFRLFFMPMMVTFLAIRAHLRDVGEGRPVFLGAFLSNPTERRRLFLSGLRDFGKVFVFACVLDTIYQYMVFRSFYLGEMLVVAVVCAVVPYFLVRGPIMRVATLLHQKRSKGSVNR